VELCFACPEISLLVLLTVDTSLQAREIMLEFVLFTHTVTIVIVIKHFSSTSCRAKL